MRQDLYQIRKDRESTFKLDYPKDKVKLTYTISDFYEDFAETHTITKKKYLSIARSLLEKLSLAIIRDRKELKLPHGLGSIRIIKRPPHSKKKIDYQKSKEHNKWIKHTNLHTNQFYFRFYWFKSSVRAKHRSLYSFKPLSDKRERLIGQRGLAAWIKKCSSDPMLKDYDALMI